MRCGFRAPASRDVAAEILAIPGRWARVLRKGATDEVLLEAARLGDELHVVASRVWRVLAAAGSAIVPAVRIDAPTTWTRPTNADQLVASLRLAAERLAAVMSQSTTRDWSPTGRAGRGSLRVNDLALIPLHRSHARLTQGRTCG
jgi:hypothetical protein